MIPNPFVGPHSMISLDRRTLRVLDPSGRQVVGTGHGGAGLPSCAVSPRR